MKSSNLLRCAAAFLLAASSHSIQAQNLTETFVGIDPGVSVTGTFNDGGSDLFLKSGVAKFTRFDAFCVDPYQTINFGETVVYQIQDFSTLASSDQIARLVGGFLDSSRSGQDAAAVQWAIWEVIAENRLPESLTDGNVRITAPANQDILLLANQYLDNINNYSAANLTYLHSDTRQDMVTWNTVPEPGSIGLGLVSGMLLLRRRRR